MNKKYFPTGSTWGCIGICLLLTACGNPQSTVAVKQHLAAVSRPGEILYVDHLDNRVVLKEEAAAGSTTVFCSFLVGWQDSTLQTDKKKSLAREKYFQYDMQKDWTALVKGDSLHPVFFQEKSGLNSQLKEGALVFEVPAGEQPDTLIYKDSFGGWDQQVLVLAKHSNDNHNRK